jgi:fucose permease
MMAGITIAVVLTITLTDAMLAPAKRAVIGTIGTWGITTNMVQWVAIGLGVYCASSWVQTIKTRDPASFALMTNRGFVSLAMTGGLMSYISYGLSPFIVLYVMKRFDLGPETGVTLGYVTVVCGATGAALGGVIGDWLKRRYPAGRMMVMLFACIASTLLVLGSFMVGDVRTFFVLSGLQIGLHIMWLGPCAASIQDLVLPRMRGTATAVFFLATTIIGLGLGPYLTGLISDVTGDLRTALLATLVVVPLILLSIAIAWRSVPALEESLIARAKAAGEPLDG